MIDPIIQFFIDLIPKLLLAEILDFTWSVTVLTLAVFIATQAAKSAARLKMDKPPSHGFIYTCSLLFSFGSAFTTWTDSPLSERLIAAFLSWGAATFSAKYGLAILKLRYPRLAAIIGDDRRKEIGPLPDNIERRQP